MNNESLNVDAAEVNKFNALAGHWWDPNGEFKALHAINPLRLSYIEQHMALAGQYLADIGCGGGILSEAMARRGAQVLGIDMSEQAIGAARQHAEDEAVSTVQYQQMTAEHLAQQQPEAFDGITCLEMLEHVPDPDAIVQACARLVKPGGHVFFSTLNRTPKAFVLAIIGAEYLLRLLPRGTHDYSKFIRPAELAHSCRTAGLVVKDMMGLHYHPLCKTYFLRANVDVNYLIYCRKLPNGA